MTKVQLLLSNGERKCKITNLIGMNEHMFIHANPAGEMFFALTERVRVIGEDFDPEDPEAIYQVLERDDVNVYFMEALIFHSPDWNRAMVDRMVEEVTPR